MFTRFFSILRLDSSAQWGYVTSSIDEGHPRGLGGHLAKERIDKWDVEGKV